MRIAIILAVCEGEIEIANEAVASLFQSLGDAALEFFIIDDASPSDVGPTLARICRDRGAEALCVKLPKGLGLLGCAHRSRMALKEVASSDREFDLVIKVDPDTRVIRDDLGAFLAEHCLGQVGIWGVLGSQYLRHRLVFLSDLLPVGFRRKVKNGRPVKQWDPTRWYPVWWFKIGMKALWNAGLRFRFAGGPFYVLAGPTVKEIGGRGYLDHRYEDGRDGFVFEEDLFVSMMVHACGHPLHDFHKIDPSFANMLISHEVSGDDLHRAGYYVVHPVKSAPQYDRLRGQLAGCKSPI